MGKNRLIREKWDFSRLAGSGSLEAMQAGSSRSNPNYATLGPWLLAMFFLLVCASQLNREGSSAVSELVLMSGAEVQRLLRACELLLPWFLNSTFLLSLIWFMTLLVFWLPRWLPATLLWAWRSISASFSGQPQPDWFSPQIPSFARNTAIFAAFVAGLTGLLLALLQSDQSAIAQAIGTTILIPDLASDVERQVKVAQDVLASLGLAAGAVAAAELAEKVIAGTKRNIGDEQERVLERLARRVKAHRPLSEGKRPKLVVVGSKVSPIQKEQNCLLLELWLPCQTEGPRSTKWDFQFDPLELVHVIDSHMSQQTDECDVVVVEGKSRRVVAYDALDKFRDLLVGDIEAQHADGHPLKSKESLALALEKCKTDRVKELLRAETILEGGTNLTAARRMTACDYDRILIVDKSGRYIGFCNFERLTREVFI